jgi:hypothetical protein
MRNFLFALSALLALLVPAIAGAHGFGFYGSSPSYGYCNYGGCAYASPTVGDLAANQVIVRHADGTFWQDGLEYAEGAILDRTSPTGWRQWYYPKPLVPTASGGSSSPAPVPLAGYQPLAGQGSTIYGYASQTASYGAPQSYQAGAAAYAPDYTQFLNQAVRLASQQNELAGKAFQGVNDTVQQLTTSQLEVAKIVATGNAAAAALNATKPQSPQTIQRSFSFQAQVGDDGRLNVVPGPVPSSAGDPKTAMMAEVQLKCASCHSGDKPRGGFAIAGVPSMDLGQFDHLLDRIESSDPAKLMPRKADGSAGAPLDRGSKETLYQYRAVLAAVAPAR